MTKISSASWYHRNINILKKIGKYEEFVSYCEEAQRITPNTSKARALYNFMINKGLYGHYRKDYTPYPNLRTKGKKHV